MGNDVSYSEVEASSSNNNNNGPKRSKLILILAAAAIALLVAVLFPVWWHFIDTARWASTRCNDNNECTADFETGTLAYCENLPFSSAKSCSSNCYATTASKHCNGRGACTADWTKCNGYCEQGELGIWSGDCNASIFPLLPMFQNATNYEDQVFEPSSYCFANQCVRVVVQAMFDVNNDTWDFWAGGSGLTCHDMLDTTTDVDTSCITATEVTVDSDSVSDYLKIHIETAHNYTARFCIFQYACGRFNSSAFADETYFHALIAGGVAGSGNVAGSGSAQPRKPRSKREAVNEAFQAVTKHATVKAALPTLAPAARQQLHRHGALANRRRRGAN